MRPVPESLLARIQFLTLVICLCAVVTAPVIASGATGDENWGTGFQILSTDDAVSAILEVGSEIYVGGTFEQFRGANINFVARWNGEDWVQLGTGLTGTSIHNGVTSLVSDGSNVYIGGWFDTPGGYGQNVLVWDGTSLSNLGVASDAGPDRGVLSMAIHPVTGDLIVGGWFSEFRKSDGTPVGCLGLVRWDGTDWHDYLGGVYKEGSGVGEVREILFDGTDMYLAGYFTHVGTPPGVESHQVAMYDGTTVHSYGTGQLSSVSAIALYGGQVHIGASGTTVPGFKRWTGSAWEDVPVNWGTVPFTGTIAELTNYQGDLVAAGTFSIYNPIEPKNNIGRWNGTDFTPMGTGTNQGVSEVVVLSNGDLAIGGAFDTVDGVEVSRTGTWNGTNWEPLARTALRGLNNVARAVTVSGGEIYAGGGFDVAGTESASFVGRYDGTQWHALGAGVDDIVRAIVPGTGSNLYVGGDFASAGGAPAAGIAEWNGTSWSALGSGAIGSVYSLARDPANGDLYAGGNFVTAGGLTANGVARWDGGTWYTLGNGVDFAFVPDVSAIAIDGSDVYIGGRFTSVDGNTAMANIARWDGSAWSPLGSGISGFIYALAIYDGNLYAGGNFSTAGGVPADNIARWDPNLGQWFDVAGGTSGIVRSLAAWEVPGVASGIFVGGEFSGSGGGATAHIANYDGTSWQPLGSGCNDDVLAMVTDGGKVVVAGAFTKAGGKPSLRYAEWTQPLPSGVADGTTPKRNLLEQNYPNPFNPNTTIAYRLAEGSNVKLRIYDVAGKLVATLVDRDQSAGPHSIVWNGKTDIGRQASSGVYFYRLDADGETITRKLTLLK